MRNDKLSVSGKEYEILLKIIGLCAMVIFTYVHTSAQNSLVTIQDSVRLRQFSNGTDSGWMSLSPDGQMLAFMVCEPNIETNVNELVLYVQLISQVRTNQQGVPPKKEVFRTAQIPISEHSSITPNHFQWLADSQHLLILHQPSNENHPIISRVSVHDAKADLVYRGTSNVVSVVSFAADANGKNFAVNVITSAPLPKPSSPAVIIKPNDSLISLETDLNNVNKSEKFCEIHLYEQNGKVSTLYRVRQNQKGAIRDLNFSPNGKWISFTTASPPIEFPGTWKKDPLFINFEKSATLLVEIQKHSSINQPSTFSYKFAFDSVLIDRLHWSKDGNAYLVLGPRPVGNSDEVIADKDRIHESTDPKLHRLYSVNPETGEVQLVTDAIREKYSEEGIATILTFDQKFNKIKVRLKNGSVSLFRRDVSSNPNDFNRWFEERQTKPISGFSKGRLEESVENETYVVGVKQSFETPPDLWMYDFETQKETRLTEINPELKSQRLGKVERVNWTGTGNQTFSGFLIYPVNFQPGKKYPAALLMKSWDDSFIHTTKYWNTFPPQQLAASEIFVLMVKSPDFNERDNHNDQIEIAMTKLELDAIKTGKSYLSERGFIDLNKVGLMGFSHNCRIIRYAITHQEKTNEPEWAAAIAVDGALNDYGNYVLLRDNAKKYWENNFYGYPPYGDKKNNLVVYSNATNAKSARTPILESFHGKGALIYAADWYSSMYVQGKPIEIIKFPNSYHWLLQPKQRQTEMEFAIDWFRFWLQGYERSDVPDDPDRYTRWNEMRYQHQWNEKFLKEGKDPSKEYMNLRMAGKKPEFDLGDPKSNSSIKKTPENR